MVLEKSDWEILPLGGISKGITLPKWLVSIWLGNRSIFNFHCNHDDMGGLVISLCQSLATEIHRFGQGTSGSLTALAMGMPSWDSRLRSLWGSLNSNSSFSSWYFYTCFPNHCHLFGANALPETNVECENMPSHKENSSSNHCFWRDMFYFQGSKQEKGGIS